MIQTFLNKPTTALLNNVGLKSETITYLEAAVFLADNYDLYAIIDRQDSTYWRITIKTKNLNNHSFDEVTHGRIFSYEYALTSSIFNMAAMALNNKSLKKNE